MSPRVPLLVYVYLYIFMFLLYNITKPDTKNRFENSGIGSGGSTKEFTSACYAAQGI